MVSEIKNQEIDNLVISQIHKFSDERGMFKKVFDQQKIENLIQMHFPIKQLNISSNRQKGTVRGMHFQRHPFEEAKIIFCTRGRINDVVIDLRPDSITYLRVKSIVMSEDDNKLIFIPAGCAHGYQSLTDNTEIIYLSDNFYNVNYESGINPLDPAIFPHWSMPITELSDRDSKLRMISRVQ